jgi:two-component system, chemotaxis family, CheB/CheR fusion protein
MITDLDAETKPFLIVTGSSAGGIDALIALVAGLPASFGAPLVIAQHLAPGHSSRLEAILKTKTSLAIRTVEDREELLPGTIYLVGPDRDIEILDDTANVVAIARRGPKPSIDRLFATAAQSHGDRLVAIIFSGMGSDGLAGARIVKEHGGTVIVQEPASASFPAMPLAIPPTLIDLFARPDAIGEMLVGLLRTGATPQESGEQALLRTLLGQLRDRSGVDFSHYKLPTIMRRLSRLMVASGVDSIGDYLRYLQNHPEGYRRLVSAFLIKVTEFFRDAALFDELRRTILPRVIAHARETGNELRIWSAGTSTGEEAYSLAILCAEFLREEGDQVPIRIFATDLDEDAIAFARRGLYSLESLRHVPPTWIEQYFVRVGDAYEVGKSIRNMTIFGQHDLGQRAPFPRVDLCLCRNVLIYFTRELQMRALQLFAFSLRDGGYLVMGKAESTGALAEYFRPVDSALKIYQRQGDRILIPPTRIKDGPPIGDPRTAGERIATMMQSPAMQRSPEPRPNTHGAFGTLIGASSIGIVVVDRRYDIIALNAAARTLLEIHGVGIGDDLIHLVRNIDGNALRALVDMAFRNEVPEPSEMGMLEPAGGVERWLQVSAAPDRAGGEIAAVFIVDVTENVGRRRELERATAEQQEQLADFGRRIDELSRRQKALLQANDELTNANTELRSMNEQLLIDAEEAASASEEIETLNEEMQATNEELETLNEELQATVEELNTTNDELEARGGDLERLAKVREVELQRLDGERSALGSVLDAFSGPLAILRQNGEVVYASASIGGPDAVGQQAEGWWRNGPVTFDGTTYEPSTRTIDNTPLVAVSLRELS